MLHCPRTFTRTIAFSGLFLATVASPAFAADPTGDWKVADGVATIRVAQCNGNMWGAVVWEKTPGGVDKHNPDPAKQTRPTLGMPILIEMKKSGADTWKGQVYNAKDGKFYSSTIKPVGTDELEIKGCVLGFLCGGETWTRVGPPIPLSVASNPMAGTPTAKGALPKSAMHGQKTTGAGVPAARPGQKQAVTAPSNANASADTVGDICLLPEIARPTQ